MHRLHLFIANLSSRNIAFTPPCAPSIPRPVTNHDHVKHVTYSFEAIKPCLQPFTSLLTLLREFLEKKSSLHCRSSESDYPSPCKTIFPFQPNQQNAIGHVPLPYWVLVKPKQQEENKLKHLSKSPPSPSSFHGPRPWVETPKKLRLRPQFHLPEIASHICYFSILCKSQLQISISLLGIPTPLLCDKTQKCSTKSCPQNSGHLGTQHTSSTIIAIRWPHELIIMSQQGRCDVKTHIHTQDVKQYS
ncbi:hypothetical protein BD289DRAFT_423435 [Coniella lustricola]|uniref:Uncharacterized protein n=1 Tax=Coniella lustricola TaxID=2025994 RepID=A0A2T3AJY6_9PEZI|nr:hypothetical protein BD289DRAFT_423435 [Coniella lustricola]